MSNLSIATGMPVSGGEEGFLRKTSTGTLGSLKSNLSATFDPTSLDGSSSGYSIGSRWINTTTDKVFECVDSTVLAAVWKDLSSTSSPGGSSGQFQINNAGLFDGISGSNFSLGVATLPNLCITDLTSTRIPVAGTLGRLQDFSSLTFNSGTGNLSATQFNSVPITALGLTSNFLNAAGTYTVPPATNPAGATGTLQYNNGAFGAVTGSSVSGANVTLGGMLDIVGPTLLFRATSTGNDAMWVLTNSAAVSGGLLIELDGNKSAYLWNGENAPLYFGTNNSLRWTVSAAGHFIAGSDNTYDIGQPGATRPRNVYVGSNVGIGTSVFGGAVSSRMLQLHGVGVPSNLIISNDSGPDRFFCIYSTGADVYSSRNTSGVWHIGRGPMDGGSFTEDWQINATGHFLAGADNTYDIGASGATRPRNVYVGNLLVVENNITTSANITAGSGYGIAWAGRSGMSSPADSVILLTNNANNNFDRLQFGGITSSFPALKRSGTTLQCRLADDNGYASFEANVIKSVYSTDPSKYLSMTPDSGGATIFGINGVSAIKLDNSSIAGETRLQVFDVDTGVLKRVRSAEVPPVGSKLLYVDP